MYSTDGVLFVGWDSDLRCPALPCRPNNIYLFFSGKYNGGTSKGTKDPKCADSKEARAVCAKGVVYRAHLSKTKTTT